MDPAALVEAINEAQAERAAAKAELDNAPAPNMISEAEVYARIDMLGDVGAALSGAKTDKMAKLYTAVDLQARYIPAAHAADVTIGLRPVNGARVNSTRVGGGT